MAGRGGFRPGSGRKPGSKNKIDDSVRRKAMESGILPLDYMLQVMRDPNATQQRRDDMAKAAAPYLHAKLQSISGPGGGAIPIDIDNLKPDQIHAVIRAIASSARSGS